MSASKRLEMLESLTQSDGADAFCWYGLAMEYRRLERFDDSLETFKTLRAKHPDYLAMYLMTGQLLLEKNRKPEAADWLQAGLALAEERGDTQATGELEDALSDCEDD